MILEKKEVLQAEIVERSEGEVSEVDERTELDTELKDAALSLVKACNAKLKLYGEDVNLTELKELARVVKEVRSAFFDVKSESAGGGVVHVNISGQAVNFFAGAIK